MRIASRVAKLEKICLPVAPKCPACGDIDFDAGEGPFYPGQTLDAYDGTHYCLCKWCGRMFRARLNEHESGAMWASQVTPEEMPMI